MEPTIFDKEQIRVEPVALGDVKRGDILLYQQENDIIVHRVVRIEKGEDEGPLFVVRGDALCTCDQPVSAWQVLGRAVSVERRGRTIRLDDRKSKVLQTIRHCRLRIRGLMIRVCLHGKRLLFPPTLTSH